MPEQWNFEGGIMKWTKKGAGPQETWTAIAGPFTLSVAPKGDGRWNWSVFKDANRNPMATGVARSFGAAKSVSEQFVNRSGLV